MSLADLYKDRALSDDEEEDEFVPSDGQSSDDGGSDEDRPAEPKETVPEEQHQQAKRRIDAIWQEMNEPALARKAPRTELQVDREQDHSEQASESPEESRREPSEAPADVKEPSGSEDLSEPNPDTPSANSPSSSSASAKAPPRRRASKFSKMAEMVEQRRAKKANTLDVARKAWSGFVVAEGLREDLDKANKDGYVERQEFLGRVDRRTYERARDMRK
ncbi:swr complex subunit [Coemansia sp. RSA 2711]|nr:swr complex subunit [Coemansia sp. RSA 2711]KAJ2322288.1 swr complex subunit [Coemansia sp. RSA 2702]